MAADDTVPMNYYRAFRDIKEAIPRDAIIVSEGANTMDIGRTQLNNYEPRTRLDAGSYGTMGVGFGFAVAAAVVQQERPVVSVSGDSAFGFSGLLSIKTAAWGTSSCSNPICLAARSTLNRLTPVALPPGRLKLATIPSLTGSPPVAKRIGIVAVAAFAASATAGLPLATIIATRRLVIRSAIIGANGSR